MSSIAGLDWFSLAGQIVAVLIGGALVIVANELAERRRQRSACDDQMQQERALYTGVFAIRNFILEHINGWGEESAFRADILALEVAQNNLHSLIEKSQPTGESLMIVLFEMRLRLDDLVVSVRSARQNDAIGASRLARKVDSLVAAVEQFDIVSQSSLSFVTEEYLETRRKRAGPTASDEGSGD